MIDSRMHRLVLTAFVLPALVFVAFSLKPSVQPLGGGLAPDAFDPVAARADLAALSAIPDRSPGSKGDAAAAAFVARQLKAAGYAVTLARRETGTTDGVKTTVVVSATRIGFSQRMVVIAADRAAGRPGSRGLTGTAALLEVGRALAGRTLAHTVELVSTGAGEGGALAGWVPHGPVVSALVLGDLAAPKSRSLVVPWSQMRAVAAPVALERSVAAAIHSETGLAPSGSGFLERVARLALPLTTTDQGALVASGVPAVAISSSGELDPGAATAAGPGFDAFGRAVLRAAGVLDGASKDWPGPDSAALPLRGRELPDWTSRLVVGMCLLAGLVVGVDAMARARRRRIAVLQSGIWLISSWPAMLFGWLWLLLASVTGVIKGVPEITAPVGSVPVSWAAVAGIPVAVMFGWIVIRPLVRRRHRGRADAGPGAPAALMIIASLAAGVIWIRDPLTALLVVPFVHVGPWLADPARAPSRGVSIGIALSLLIPVGIVLAVAGADFGAGPLALGWLIALVFASGSAGLTGGLMTTLFAGLYVSTVALAWRPRPDVDLDLVTRGPLGYAGPGSLGGTD